jgi:hypothetical protein
MLNARIIAALTALRDATAELHDVCGTMIDPEDGRLLDAAHWLGKVDEAIAQLEKIGPDA